ncbi:MAG TPA: substrate-binding domain-containing protein [Bryobacteraceae bacterium]|nr:substrate-binding domain-containing protein [Bryobacteraceae bacterium]
MKRHVAWAIPILLAHFALAQSPIRVLASNGMRTVVEQLKPATEKATGQDLAIEYNSTAGLKPKLESGQGYDVAIVTVEMMDELVKSGKIAPQSRVDLARGAIGVGIRAGSPKPDIKTPAALKQALLKAKAVSYAQDGASRPAIEKMFSQLGVAGQMKTKILLEQGSVRSAGRVASGDADFVLTLMSEILPVKGLELVGPLPAQYQGYVSFAAGVSANAVNPSQATTLVKFLASPANASVYKAKGLEPR